MLLGVTQVQGIHHHVDVGAVLAAHLALGNIDHLDALGMKLPHRGAVVAPVAVGTLVHDAALLQQALEHQRHLEITPFHVAHAQGQILEIHEDGNQRFIGHGISRIGMRPSVAA